MQRQIKGSTDIYYHQVDVDAIVERHRISHMQNGVSALEGLVNEWSSAKVIPEVDWARMRSLDFQEILASRNAQVKLLGIRACGLCSNFDDHVRL